MGFSNLAAGEGRPSHPRLRSAIYFVEYILQFAFNSFSNPLPYTSISHQTSVEIMAEHNIVVFAGDHCGPEVIDYPRAFSALTLDGEKLTLVN
jgi:hypothetical protein